MKPRALKFSIRAVACLVISLGGAGVLWAADPPPDATAAAATPGTDTPPPLANGTLASPSAGPATTLKSGKKPKVPGAPPKVKAPKEIPFPLPVGEDTHKFKIPELGLGGQLLSQMMAAQATRLDNEHVQMHELTIDLYHPDGKEDFHIILPTSVFNLKTHIITSDAPVTVKTGDFELTGERMEFNTVDRTGKLLGHVAMHVHNLKQVAAAPGTTPVPK